VGIDDEEIVQHPQLPNVLGHHSLHVPQRSRLRPVGFGTIDQLLKHAVDCLKAIGRLLRERLG
ncbi:MAG TPA: hypothetical protein VGY57_05605, partial [Vicinamibacterales bacterium]|nr:hypothetical protein [Vicinamibacterales bacterium]